LGNGSLRYLFENCALDTDRRELRRGAELVAIPPQVFDLLDYLIRNREHVVSKDDLIEAIWKGRIVSETAVTTRLNAARSAIGDTGEEQRLIKTLPRKGFRFVGAVQEAQKIAVEFADVGEQNLAHNDRLARADRVKSVGGTLNAALPLPDKPSIAVLPFENMTEAAENVYFSDGIAEDIITELSRYPDLFVIARNSSFIYRGRAVRVTDAARGVARLRL
jgi:adenylate cyclase